MGLVTFRDARRVEWQVCEVSRTQIEAHRERQAAGGSRRGRHGRWSLLPGLDGGWLSFESWWQKRRLTSYPADWRGLPSVELERLCEQAVAVPELGARGAVRPRDTPVLPGRPGGARP